MRAVRLCMAAAAAGAAMASVAPAALAATATLEYEEPVPGLVPEPAYTLTVLAGPGEANGLLVGGDQGGYTVVDRAVPLTAGAGCVALGANAVRCPTGRPAVQRSVFVHAGDGSDYVRITGLSPPQLVELHGGPGDDVLIGGDGDERLHGGPGDDSLAGGAGNDLLDGGPGDDYIDGGPGIDEVSYESRRRPVRVDLAAGTGGQQGEHDTIVNVENATGGRGADRIAGDSGPNLLVGGRGSARDVLIGRGGDDVLIGFRARGGPGNDSIDARRIGCGRGDDVIYRLRFRHPGPFPRACPTVSVRQVFVSADPVARSARRAVYRVSCSRRPRCGGRLELRDRDGILGGARFSFRRADRPGAAKRVRIRLTRRPAGRLVTLRVFGPRPVRDAFRTRLR